MEVGTDGAGLVDLSSFLRGFGSFIAETKKANSLEPVCFHPRWVSKDPASHPEA